MVKKNNELQPDYQNNSLQALFSNAVLVSASKYDFVINFGVTAPTLKEDETEDETLPLVLIFMTKSSAKDLAEQLNGFLKTQTPREK